MNQNNYNKRFFKAFYSLCKGTLSQREYEKREVVYIMSRLGSAVQTGVSRFLRNLPFFISGCAVLVMNMTSSVSLMVAALLFLILVVATCCFDRIYTFFKSSVNKKIAALAVGLALLSGVVYYESLWRDVVLYSSKLEALYIRTGIPKQLMALSVVAVLSMLSIYFFGVILCLFTTSYLKAGEKRQRMKVLSKVDGKR